MLGQVVGCQVRERGWFAGPGWLESEQAWPARLDGLGKSRVRLGFR